MKNKLIAIILALVALVSVAGCSAEKPKKEKTNAAQESEKQEVIIPAEVERNIEWLKETRTLTDVKKRFGNVLFEFTAGYGDCYSSTDGWNFIFDFQNQLCVEYAVPLNVKYPGLVSLADEEGLISSEKMKEYFDCEFSLRCEMDGYCYLDPESGFDSFECDEKGNVYADQQLWKTVIEVDAYEAPAVATPAPTTDPAMGVKADSYYEYDYEEDPAMGVKADSYYEYDYEEDPAMGVKADSYYE